MAIKKSELYSSLWSSCDELRGGMDASQYKDDVLVLLFVKYVSDKYAGDPNALINVPAASKQVKEAQQALDAQVAAKYAQLTEAEIKNLVVDDRWLAALALSVQGELDRVSQTLTGRIRQLAERCEKPLPELEEDVARQSGRTSAKDVLLLNKSVNI
jgi:type I restriction-modification system DNA methylase subunit